MDKVLLEYDSISGGVFSKGINIANIKNLSLFEGESKLQSPVYGENLIRLKEAGFSADEIVELKVNGVI